MPEVTLKMHFAIPGAAPLVEVQHALREVAKALTDDPETTWFPIRGLDGAEVGECHVSISEESADA